MSTTDIDDVDFLRAVKASAKGEVRCAMVWDVAESLGVNELQARKKFRRVFKRGLVAGCNCGCRGDFELTPQGVAALREAAMIIPRYDNEMGMNFMVPDSHGYWVTQHDHAAAIEAMRDACIAAVEEVDGSQAIFVLRRNVLAALREIQA